MSNNYWDEDEDDLDTDNIGGDGSDLLKKLRKAKRSDEKRIKELTEQLEGLSKSQRERSIKEVLENQGVNPKIAKFILKDIDDVSEESITNWLEENIEAFGYTFDEDGASDDGGQERTEYNRQDSLTEGALTPDREQEMAMRIDNATSEDELRAILNTSR